MPKASETVLSVLDNPIWNALLSGNKEMAHSVGNAAYIRRDIGWFAGMKHNGPEELDELCLAMPANSSVILFTPGEITIPDSWRIKVKRPVLQMIYEGKQITVVDDPGIVPLGEQDIPAMLELTKMTNPGPFFSRTIEFGNYEGIFSSGQLIAMIGQRLKPYQFSEVSAVCTHPDHIGHGYAAKLLMSQLSKITTASQIPFLHVYPENTGACNLYWKLGFKTRKEILVYFLEQGI